jgi:membrane-bound lytic murein transglycosylase D
MEPDPQHKCVSLFFLSLFFFIALPFSQAGEASFPEYDEALIIERLKAIEDPLVEHRFNSIVKGYIKSYLIHRRRNAELVTGRAVLYYPIIEDYLKAYELPEKLKYLPVVESALNPHAVSPVGAMGLWQFMPGTAKDYGLKIDNFVDERKDPHRSTEAALIYLKTAYEKYGDWALALAAYNGGSGRVSRAIKRGRSKNFWKIRRYLPRETRNYVPAYIAATYLMEYYKEHEVLPDYPNLELQITEAIEVYHSISFHRIAQITGVSMDILKTLNPSYKRELVPENEDGNFIILPSRVMQAFKDYLNTLRTDQIAAKIFDNTPVVAKQTDKRYAEQYVKSVYEVKAEEQLPAVAEQLGCTIHQLVAWNNLKTEELAEGQQLAYYRPKELIRFKLMKKVDELPELQGIELRGAQVASVSAKGHGINREYFIYISPVRQKLSELVARLPGITLPMLMDYNELPATHKIQEGDQLLIPLNY